MLNIDLPSLQLHLPTHLTFYFFAHSLCWENSFDFNITVLLLLQAHSIKLSAALFMQSKSLARLLSSGPIISAANISVPKHALHFVISGQQVRHSVEQQTLFLPIRLKSKWCNSESCWFITPHLLLVGEGTLTSYMLYAWQNSILAQILMCRKSLYDISIIARIHDLRLFLQCYNSTFTLLR